MSEQKQLTVPSRKDIFVLRTLIIIGCLTMVIFFVWLLRPEHYGHTWLYYILVSIMFFGAFKVIAEWYHYFNIKTPVPPENARVFTVDIFTTYCAGEPLEMIEETLRAIKDIRYPHESYLCDEANNTYLKNLCKELGIHHVTREKKINAKAGNINNALKQSKGEICVILDPDHVPEPGFLDPIIPYFNNPEIGFVQIVQAYKNIRESIISRGAAQQTFQFYGPMMMSMNSYGTVLAIGANCTFRREALDSIGGHAPGLAEDMHTAMQLHAKGWKSVYVPKILARGLVPSSLDAYYKQQLKWSRGVFELLFTTYVKLFKNFTWRQKIHYGTLPFHYFSGVVYFLNFLIPILALFLAVIPLRVDLIQFLFIGAPFLANTLIIRHYVQRWVMEEEERGFHLIGGILQIGTWWVHSLGFIYSVLRKKVPYIPTPKAGEEGNNFLLNLPNIIVVLISLFAIVYGISIDYNPYTFVMAGLAGTNCLFMAFMIVAGEQRKITSFREKYQTRKYTRGYISALRTLFWNTKHAAYAFLRKVALPVSLLLTIFSFTYMNRDDDPGEITIENKKGSFYLGIFSPKKQDGLISLQAVTEEEQFFNRQFDMVSCYIPWGDNIQNDSTERLIESIVREGYYPMITWEPWVSTFHRSGESEELKYEKRGLAHIAGGMFDDYVVDFALKIKALKQPVFLRYAHEPDNPAYPWSTTGENTPADFVNSWRHVHAIFDSVQARNVIWVWSPWKHENLPKYFPGEKYVDWLGITGLDYGPYNPDGKTYEFEEYYRPFSNDSIFQKDIPVMIAEFGSLLKGERQLSWMANAYASVRQEFPEIRAIVLFNSDLDANIPGESSNSERLNWKVEDSLMFEKAGWTSTKNSNPGSILSFTNGDKTTLNQAKKEAFNGLQGINYRKGNTWFRNFYALTYRVVDSDFRKIKNLGITTIKWNGPGVYDRNILKAAAQHKLDVHYSFWLPNDVDFVKNRKELDEYTEDFLTAVERLRGHPAIKSWNIGNGTWQNLQNTYYEPDLFAQQSAYLIWLKNFVDQIAEMDGRPVTVDVEVTDELAYVCEMISSAVPKVAAFGLIYKDPEIKIDKEIEKFPVFYSDILPNLLLEKGPDNKGDFISSFQDLGTPNYVSYDGLVDHNGVAKREYFQVMNLWGSKKHSLSSDDYDILKRANPLVSGEKSQYYVIKKTDEEWSVVNEGDDKGSVFHWFLIKTDGYGNGIYTKFLGCGTKMDVISPENYKNFELLLVADVGDYVIQKRTRLHTPLTGKESKR